MQFFRPEWRKVIKKNGKKRGRSSSFLNKEKQNTRIGESIVHHLLNWR